MGRSVQRPPEPRHGNRHGDKGEADQPQRLAAEVEEGGAFQHDAAHDAQVVGEGEDLAQPLRPGAQPRTQSLRCLSGSRPIPVCAWSARSAAPPRRTSGAGMTPEGGERSAFSNTRHPRAASACFGHASGMTREPSRGSSISRAGSAQERKCRRLDISFVSSTSLMLKARLRHDCWIPARPCGARLCRDDAALPRSREDDERELTISLESTLRPSERRPSEGPAQSIKCGGRHAERLSSPNAPAEVERQLRQEAGFGCAKCGHPYIEYHHIIPFSEEPHFRSEDMVALCGNCHPAVAKLQPDRQYDIKHNAHNVRKGVLRGALEFDKRDLIFKVGGNWYENTPVILKFLHVPIISCSLEGAQAKVSLNLLGPSGQRLLSVKDNDVTFRIDDLWDFEYAHNFAVARYGPRDIALRMDFRNPEAIIEGKISAY